MVVSTVFTDHHINRLDSEVPQSARCHKNSSYTHSLVPHVLRLTLVFRYSFNTPCLHTAFKELSKERSEPAIALHERKVWRDISFCRSCSLVFER